MQSSGAAVIHQGDMWRRKTTGRQLLAVLPIEDVQEDNGCMVHFAAPTPPRSQPDGWRFLLEWNNPGRHQLFFFMAR
jgi:hypothetical protein